MKRFSFLSEISNGLAYSLFISFDELQLITFLCQFLELAERRHGDGVIRGGHCKTDEPSQVRGLLFALSFKQAVLLDRCFSLR